ncbi:MAG: DEAD/DEAH box helicase [Melioribacteraceae bacterium]|nr:DEAD/DEAH box helicase [Melioribacteraceae bacterium]MCF8356354.1 DEAD/DEAH box helicase [Melioribacteraceae bacterium]MCF8395793.1 DEAD/DEAH box helicase [Melioribacteraceae bacterium]MCF8420658.1 DEAD/DEAH box helicase [Melioribacteraceae bacterium]
MTFNEIGISKELFDAVTELGFINPTPIQENVIPFMMENKGRDLIALAQTGTGKTAAYGLPIIQNVNVNDKSTQYLILSPTRELCIQIANDLIDYSKYVSQLRVVPVFGGASVSNQINLIKKGAQIIVATPGRLIDLMNRNVIKLGGLKTLVLDEADEMLDMGFREDLEEILTNTPKEKNTLLFSATMPNSVMKITKNYMNSPHEISVGKRNAGAENVNHMCFTVHERDRYLALKRIVDFYPDIYGIIFCRTRQETKTIAAKLITEGYNAEALHGDLSQEQRDTVMGKFRIKHISLLVATDVAARGLDITNLTHIINYNLPDDLEIYIHRSGRTGRAGKNGTSIAIINLREKFKIRDLERMIKKSFSHHPVPSGKEICEKQLFHLIEKMEKVEVDNNDIDQFLPSIYKKLEWMEREDIIRRFVSLEFLRFLDYYKDTVDLNMPVDSKKGKRNSSADSGYVRFFINLGRRDDLKPTTLIGMINDNTGVRDISLGEIEILKNFSFFEADGYYRDLILKSFENLTINKRKINIEVAEKKKSGGESRNFRSKSNDKRRSKRPDKDSARFSKRGKKRRF